MVNDNRIVDKFIEFIKIDSETGNEDVFSKHIAKELSDLGVEVYVDKVDETSGTCGNNVYGFLKGDLDIAPIILSSHLDTVVNGQNIEPIITDGIISSKGNTILGSDDKAGVTAILEAIRVIKENSLSHGPVEIIFTVGEESGMVGSKNLEYNRLKSREAYVFDSSGDVGKIINQAPAQSKLTVTILGKPSHAGIAPENGVSSIQVAADAIYHMKQLRIDEETTANVGIISGGTATNIVCDNVKVVAEARSLNNDKLKDQSNHMLSCFEDAANKYGARLDYSLETSYLAYKIDEDENLIKRVNEIMKENGIDSYLAPSGGGSDANIYNGNGIKAINLGVGMTKVHTSDEFIAVKSLIETSKIALDLITRKK